MGIIAVLLYSTGHLHGEFHVPHWVAFSCYVAIGLGTLTGRWRIIETMGTRITKLDQHQGFSASAGGSVMLFTASWLGFRFDHAHHYRLRDRRRRGPAGVGGALACRRKRDGRLGHHHPGFGLRRSALLLSHHILLEPAGTRPLSQKVK